MSKRGMAGAAFINCDTFSSSVIRPTRSSTRASTDNPGSLYFTDVSVVPATSSAAGNRNTPNNPLTFLRNIGSLHKVDPRDFQSSGRGDSKPGPQTL